MYNRRSTNNFTTMATKSDRNTPFEVHNFWPEAAFSEPPTHSKLPEAGHRELFERAFGDLIDMRKTSPTIPDNAPTFVLNDSTKDMLKVLGKTEEAKRFDEGKTNWSLIPFEAVEDIAKVLEFGAKKYAAWNFTNAGGMNHSRVINSCLRHLFAYMRGEDKDPESGLSHLSHAGCNILFLLYYNKYPDMFKAKDDRHVR